MGRRPARGGCKGGHRRRAADVLHLRLTGSPPLPKEGLDLDPEALLAELAPQLAVRGDYPKLFGTFRARDKLDDAVVGSIRTASRCVEHAHARVLVLRRVIARVPVEDDGDLGSVRAHEALAPIH